jgi:GDPmannose 4,6-dehydratase
MWMMLQQEIPDDYVVSTGETHSVREFVELAFSIAGITNWEDYVSQSQDFMRPAEVDYLIGDPAKARNVLGWQTETTFEQLVTMMVENDLRIETQGTN